MNNKKLSIALVLIIALFAAPAPAHAFSFKGFFDNIFAPKAERALQGVPLEANTSKTLVPTATVAPAANPTANSTALSSTGTLSLTAARIMQLQSDLKTLGYYADGIDGSYGKLTTEAVLKFQRANALSATGTIDQKMLDALQKICIGKCPVVTIAQCMDGKDNDGDGLADYPADPGCSSSLDTDESNAAACAITSFTVPRSVPHASSASPTVSWTTSGCTGATLVLHSGSGFITNVLPSAQVASGAYTFDPGRPITLSAADTTVDLSIIATTPTDTVSQTKEVPITGVPAPTANQCFISTFSATPSVVSAGQSTLLQWISPAGCEVMLFGWTPANGFTPVVNQYQPSTGSLLVAPATAMTYYASSETFPMSASSNDAVLSVKTVDVNRN